MCNMRILFALFVIALLLVGQVWAQPPERLVAQTGWPHRERVFLFVDACDANSRRAQHITHGNRVRWGCWRYNEAGVAIDWSVGTAEFIDYLSLYRITDAGARQMGYWSMHDRVRLLTFMNQ